MLNNAWWRRKLYGCEIVRAAPYAYNRTELWLYICASWYFLILEPATWKTRGVLCNPAGFSKPKLKPPKMLPLSKISLLLSQFLSQLTVKVICGALMLMSRPSLTEKGKKDRWLRFKHSAATFAECIYCVFSVEVLLAGGKIGLENSCVSVDMAVVYISYNTKLNLSIASVTHSFPFAFWAVPILNQPRWSSLPARSFHRLLFAVHWYMDQLFSFPRLW